MVVNQKTPSQHNSTLYISPLINNRRQDVFITPPNPAPNLFHTPGSDTSSFYNLDRTSANNQSTHNASNYPSEPLTRAEKLRLWRHDALMQHHYKNAEYIGDKVLSLTNDPNDAFWLGQVYFNSGNYLRAKQLLTSKPEYEKSVSCRYLAAYSLIKLELWDDALDLIGETNPFHKDDNYQVRNADGGIKLEASMCYLRGLIYANQNNFEKAKESYKEAVLVDVKCFEAFNELISNDFMTPSEEWEFITTLNYRDADDNDELIKLLYTSRLSKYLNILKFEEAESILKEEYRLGENSDILLSRADFLYIQCNFDECLTICEKILSKDQYNFNLMPNYLSCLYELGGKNKLFLKAHQLAENHPTNPMTWLAIGIYYLSINKVIEARKFFSKATLLNPNFGQAWIGFAHTFAAEGEHEQAISAYAFATRLFPGTHLPNLFLGMQHLQMNNLNLAEEYLLASYQICNSDPLLLNELGVIYFHKESLMKAEMFFQEALGAAKYLNSDLKTWISIHANLGHVYRRGNQLYRALECFNQVLKISHKNDSNILSATGLIYLKLGNFFKAIDILHDALAISPNDSVASDLLKRALEANKDKNEIFMKSIESQELNLPTLQYRKHKSNNILEPLEQEEQPILNSSFIANSDEVSTLANELKRGEETSDDDDGEIMDIESD
ncbi:anaphase-promoting complex component [Hyphopichia burtonii NRRL Y-1933]|uniref:Anaphase-promoting complex component n=1 Tax=Hyphopichia burtonii NRRL Y-1933 TaxID=984485 RepID=A0A1E4RC27_9ASCO|nr:anaphase-promoting complex component [Hyphopichia burtonii NRRL Y-1933]ODV64828.1 anaphase-promoting complex component [Hyphopichia burtonii NRRL Y-1933]